MRVVRNVVQGTRLGADRGLTPAGAVLECANRYGMWRRHTLAVVGPIVCLLLGALVMPAFADTGKEQPVPIKLAVFDFELDDVSAGASNAGEKPADIALLKAVSEKARQVMVQSGRYSLVDTGGDDSEPVKGHSLKTCDGCEAAIALKLGAEQSLLGVVTRVEMSSYAVRVQMRDARTGKLVNQQSAVFLGSDDGWSNGAASLLRHRVLSNDFPP